MTTAAPVDTAQALLLQLVRERNQLRSDLTLARAALIEFENQNVQLDRLLSEAHAAIQQFSGKQIVPSPSAASFIGPWHSSPEYPILHPIEKLLKQGHIQQALTKMPPLMTRTDLDNRHKVNIRLLNAALLHSSGTQFRRALQCTEEALAIATAARLYDLAAKGQFWRGLCYLGLDEYGSAALCFILASHLGEHDSILAELKQQAENQMSKLPQGHPKRALEENFQFCCNACMDGFIQGT